MLLFKRWYHGKNGREDIKGGLKIVKRVLKSLNSVGEVEIRSLPDYDCIILGSPTYYGLPSAEMKEFLDESITHHGYLDGKVGGAFTSSANTAGGNETTIMALLESLIIPGMIVKGMPKGGHYGPVGVGKPDEEELKQCTYYDGWMAEFLEKITSLEG